MASQVTVPLPPKAWMHKPRSQKTDGGFFARFRGSGSWQRRCVSIQDHAICYGENINDKSKVVPLQTVTLVERLPRDKLIKDEAPVHFADFGWSFAYETKVVVFACEDLETREAWVTYLEAFLEAMRNMAPSTAAASEAATAQGGATTLAAMAASTPGDIGAAAVPGAAPLPDNALMGLDEDDEGSGGGRAGRRHTQDQLKRLVGGGGDDEDGGGGLDWDDEGVNKDDEDDDDDSDDDDDEDGDGMSASAMLNAPRLLVERQLRQIAQQTYNHVAYKMDKYASNFAEGDTPKDVVFSRQVFKVSKKNNNIEKDLVLTQKRLYLFSIGGIVVSTVTAKAIEIDQIVGVVESTESSSLFALLIPSWHDMLLRIAPQNSVLGGTEAEVKTQLIAHLFVLSNKIAPGRQFLFREAANVPSIIRRSEDDEHQPLMSEEGDRFRVASNAELFPTFRVNAESVVYLSCHVQRVNAEMAYSPRIFIVTDGGVYLAHADGQRISKRASLSDIGLMKCDSEMHGVFLQLPEMDMVVYAKTQQDYQAVVRWVPEAAQRGCRHTVRVTPSRNLLHGARLQDTKGLLEHLTRAGASTEEGLLAAFKMAKRATKASWKLSKQGIGWLGKGVENIATGSVDLIKQGATEVGGILLDNKITGELRGLTESMLSIAGQASSRIVLERIMKLSDVDKYCELKEPTTDSLKMAGTPTLQELGKSHKEIDTSIIFFSSRAKHFALTSSLDTSRTGDMFVLLTASGIVLLDDPSGSSNSMVTGSKTLLTRAFKSLTGGQMGLQLNEFIPWSETKGVMRCVAEPNLLGIVNNTSAVTTLRDVMLRLPNSKLAESFIAHYLNLFATNRTPPEDRGFWKVLPGYYQAATGEHLRHALKGTAFEPDATVALRAHALGGDELRISADNMVVDQIRRYGDNSVRFSALAWRLKTSTVRKDPTQALKAATGQMTEVGSHGAGLDRKLYKQCGLVITNCAVYQFEDGAKTINRRLEILHISKIKRCMTDPDAVLLVVPKEYDFFIRIEGRAQEFIDKLIEARNEWSDIDLDLATEIDSDTFMPRTSGKGGSSSSSGDKSGAGSGGDGGSGVGVGGDGSGGGGGSRYHIPLTVENINEPVFNVGRLVKPKNFSDEQSNIASADVLEKYTSMLMLEVRRALDEKESHGGAGANEAEESQTAAAAESSSSHLPFHGGSTIPQSAKASPLFPVLHFERAFARVRFATERAFNFGLRANQPECTNLAIALTFVEFHRRWRDIVGRLQYAVQTDMLSDFQSAEIDGRSLAAGIAEKFNTDPRRRCALTNLFLDSITTTIELQKPQLEAMKSRAVIKQEVERLIQRAAQAGPEGVIADLEESIVRAEQLGVQPVMLDGFRSSFDAAVQTHRMSHVASFSWAPPLRAIFEEAQRSVAEANNSANAAAPTSATAALQQIHLQQQQQAHQQQQHANQNRARSSLAETLTLWATRTLESAVNAGDLQQLDFEMRAVNDAFSSSSSSSSSGSSSSSSVASLPPSVAAAMARAKDLADELRKNETVLLDLRRLGDDFRRRASVGRLSCDQLSNFEQEFAEVLQQLPANVPSLRAARDTACVLFSTVQLQRKLAEQQEEAVLEEKALAAAYSKSANEDAIASAQRYERAQRAKLEAQMLQRRRDAEEIVQRGSQLLFEVKRSVAAEDLDRVQTMEKTIDGMLADMEVMLGRCASEKEVQALEGGIVLRFRKDLSEARSLALSFAESHSSRRGMQLPPEAIAAAQKLDQKALVAYVESGELDIASLKTLGEIWAKAAERKKHLHRLRQRAFVIDSNDDAAVASLLNEAVSIGAENDVVIAKVRESHQKSKAAAPLPASAASAASSARGFNRATSSSLSSPSLNNAAGADNNKPAVSEGPKFVPPAVYDLGYPWVSCKGGGIMLDVHGALSAMLRKPGIIDSKREAGRYELPKETFAADIKDFCTRVQNFLLHRVKPVGFFRKTQRSLFDLITELGKISRSGEIIAPFCAHLVGEFERVKKLNNANGLTSDQVLVRLLLSKRDLQRIFDDLCRLNAKERENLFFDDSVWVVSDDVATKDMTLLAKMTAQIVWPFSFTDRREHMDVGSGARLSTDALAALGGAGNAGSASDLETGSIAVSSVAPGGAVNAATITVDQAVATMRHAVRCLSSFFQTEMRALGVEATAEQKRQIFDETRTKMCGVIVREELCAAIGALFKCGIKPATGLLARFNKKSPWDIVVSATDSVRKSAHGLSAVALPEAVDTVLSLTDPAMASSKRGVSTISKMNAEQLADVRFRIFLCYALNRKILSSVLLKAMFDANTPTGAETITKFYIPEKCAFNDEEARGEVVKLFEYIEKLPFVLSLDAEIW